MNNITIHYMTKDEMDKDDQKTVCGSTAWLCWTTGWGSVTCPECRRYLAEHLYTADGERIEEFKY